MKTAARMAHLAPFYFASLNDRLRALQTQGKEIIRLDIGSPDMPPAPHIIEALARAASRADAHGYQAHSGPPALRQAWADYYREQYQGALDPDLEILPLMGSKEGIFQLSQAFLEPGDAALAPDPGYITYTRGALFSGARVYPIPLLAERNFQPDLDAIPPDDLRQARLLWLNYPNNPTGASASLEVFQHAVAFAREHNLIVCHDAAYTQVFFNEKKPPSLLQVEGALEVAVEFNTLSKSHNMAGWRSAALLGNRHVLRTLLTLKTNLDSSHFLPIFEASIAALRGDQSWLRERNAVYRGRRDAVLRGLEAAGLSAQTPEAAMYVWAKIPDGWDCQEFAVAALENTGVSLTPGTVFGQGGAGYVRIALTAPVQRIELAMERLGKWFVSRKEG